MSVALEDQARFEAEDCAALVLASFACRSCLKAPDLITLTGAPGSRLATSKCAACGAMNRVSMSDTQAFKLWTLQRGNTFVHFAPQHW
ncbi:hypothetical protein [Conexibacter sp. S30A1]|jgi:hypothetical protein|uniref:hypothetical protein n=1 Tax=Conexibacter sp. S30A1 TaxID=2937800 RepID=UPI00200FF6C9|nr:hypothetical protein [Conexibacter sp. S30A1]